MSVEQLIERLKKMPPYYEVQAHFEGVEVEDFESDVFDVTIDESCKRVNLEIQQG